MSCQGRVRWRLYASFRMLEVVPLGGLGEFGMNMMALTCDDTTIVVDAGVMFPDPELLGVDRIIPDLSYLEHKHGVAALVLTHGHEDHIGAVPHIARLVRGNIYATPLTLALVEPKLVEHGIDDAVSLVPVRPRQRTEGGRHPLPATLDSGNDNNRRPLSLLRHRCHRSASV